MVIGNLTTVIPSDTPFGPDRTKTKQLGFSAQATWGDGLDADTLLRECDPLINSYLLLGYRVMRLRLLDYTTVPWSQSPPDGRYAIDLVTDDISLTGGVEDILDTSGQSYPLADLEFHVVFDLEPFDDNTGYLTGSIQASETGTYKGYGVTLAGAEMVLSVAAPTPSLSALQDAIDALLQTLFDKIVPLLPTRAENESLDALPRDHQGGMVWIFDPSHWYLIRKDARAPEFEYPKKLVQILTWHDNAMLADRFLKEQIFGIRLGKTFHRIEGTEAPQAPSIAACAGFRRNGDPPAKGRPTFKTYDLSPTSTAQRYPGESGVNYTSFISADSTFKYLIQALEQRGDGHVISFKRRDEYLGGNKQSWLDCIKSMAWEGVIAIPDLVIARDPPEPFEIRERWSNFKCIRYDVYVREQHTLRMDLMRPNEAGGDLTQKVCIDYKRGSRTEQAHLMVVAGRGVSISSKVGPAMPGYARDADFKQHFKAFFDLYAAQMPWSLTIFRVQDDNLVPSQGTDIQTATFLSPIWFNPSPDKEKQLPSWDEPRKVPLIDLTFRRTHVDDDGQTRTQRFQSGVRIEPHPHGARLVFPAVSEIQEDTVTPAHAGLGLYQATVTNAATFEIYVDPFSGVAAYSFDLFMERFAGDGGIVKNLHAVFLLMGSPLSEIELKSSLPSQNGWFAQALASLLNMPADANPEHSGYWGNGGEYLAEITSEIWKVKESDIHALPRPLEGPFPVTLPRQDKSANWTVLYDDDGAEDGTDRTPLNREGQSLDQMPSTFSGDGWAEVYFGPTEIEVRRATDEDWKGNETIAQIAYALIDLSMGIFIPVLGDIVDVAEFALALMTGRDRWGRPVTNFDLTIMALGAAVPVMSTTFARFGADTVGGLTPNFGMRSLQRSASTNASNTFLEPFIGMVATADTADEAALMRLYEAAEALLEPSRLNKTFREGAHNEAAREFALELLTSNGRLVSRIAELGTDAPSGFLRFEDLLSERGDGFAFSILQGPFLKKQAQLFKADPDAPLITPQQYLEEHARGHPQVVLRALLGDSNVGKAARRRKRPGRSPTFAARAARDGNAVALSTMEGDTLITHTVAYFKAILDNPKGHMMVGAGYSPDHMAEARGILRDAGFVADASADIDDNHKIIVLLKELMGGQDAGYPLLDDMLRAGRVEDKKLPPAEIGARVGEAFLMALDQMKHKGGFDASQAASLSELGGGTLNPAMRDFVSQWVNSSGGAYEHALKSELLESAAIHSRVHAINAGAAAHPVHGDLSGFQFAVVSQAKLPSTSGNVLQKASDEVVYFELNGTLYAADMQLKSYRSVDSAVGFNVVGGEAVNCSHFFRSAVPKIERVVTRNPAGERVVDFKVRGGSAIYNQVVKQRIRRAQYGGYAPPAAIAKDPPLTPPAGRPGWARESTRHVYTIDTGQFMDELADKLFRSIPAAHRANVIPSQVKELKPEEVAFLETIFPHLTEVGNTRGINLYNGLAFHEAFEENKDIVRVAIMRQINGYETRVEGFDDAMRALTGNNQHAAHEVYIRFTSDADMDEALAFIAGRYTPDLDDL